MSKAVSIDVGFISPTPGPRGKPKEQSGFGNLIGKLFRN